MRRLQMGHMHRPLFLNIHDIFIALCMWDVVEQDFPAFKTQPFSVTCLLQ